MLPSADGTSGMFLSPVPVPPGDPAALAGAAATYTAAQGEIERSRATLTSVASQAGGAAWTGSGATGFTTSATSLASAYAVASGALAQGASALKAYAADLATAQRTARQANAAVAQANATASAVLTAQSSAQRSQAAADDAAQASATADAHATANPHSPGAQLAATSARAAASDTSATANSAWQQVSTLTGSYDAQRSHALALSAEAASQATQAASKAAAGFNAAAASLTGSKGKPVWQKVLHDIPVWNDRAGWVLSPWGLFGAFAIGKAGIGSLRAESALSTAAEAEAGVFLSWYDGEGSWPAWGRAIVQTDVAASAATHAAENLRGAIAPAPDDWRLGTAVSRVGMGLGIASDVVVLAHPSPSWGPGGILGGHTDQAMAGLNLTASGVGLASSLGLIPVVTNPVGVVVVGGVVIGTATYFAGEFVYQHWGDITNAVGSAGSWAVHEGSSFVGNVGRGAEIVGGDAVHEGSSFVGNVGRGAEIVGGGIIHGVASLADDIPGL